MDDTNICKKCEGWGRRTYPNTATYMSKPGMMAGQALRSDICDECWGSGDNENPFRDLKQIREELAFLKPRQKLLNKPIKREN